MLAIIVLIIIIKFANEIASALDGILSVIVKNVQKLKN
jgi:hypothetical protein